MGNLLFSPSLFPSKFLFFWQEEITKLACCLSIFPSAYLSVCLPVRSFVRSSFFLILLLFLACFVASKKKQRIKLRTDMFLTLFIRCWPWVGAPSWGLLFDSSDRPWYDLCMHDDDRSLSLSHLFPSPLPPADLLLRTKAAVVVC